MPEVCWVLLAELCVGSRLEGSDVPTGLHTERSTHVPINQGLQYKVLVCGLSVAHRYVFSP